MQYKLEDVNIQEEYNQLTIDQKEELQSWIKGRFIHCKTINKTYTSYGYKHIFENDRHGFYISNEQFKGAMLEAGYIPRDKLSKNWNFYVKFFTLANDDMT